MKLLQKFDTTLIETQCIYYQRITAMYVVTSFSDCINCAMLFLCKLLNFTKTSAHHSKYNLKQQTGDILPFLSSKLLLKVALCRWCDDEDWVSTGRFLPESSGSLCISTCNISELLTNVCSGYVNVRKSSWRRNCYNWQWLISQVPVWLVILIRGTDASMWRLTVWLPDEENSFWLK